MSITKRSIKSEQRLMRVLSAKKTGLGTPALGGTCANNMTITDGGVGNYTINFNTPFEQIPEIIVVPTTADRFLRLGTVAVGSAQILAFSMSASSSGTFVGTDGSTLYNWVPGAGDIKGSTAPAGTEENADQAAGPTNAALIGAEETFTVLEGAAKTKTISAQTDIARNVIIVIHNDTVGSLDLFEGVTTFTVTGTFRGAAQTDTITITSTGGDKAVAAAKFRYKAGVKPFDTITSIVYDNAGAGDLKVSVAPGSLLGYPVDSDTGAEADFLKATVTAANYVITGKVSVTNKTFNVGTIADAADVAVVYKVDQDAVSGNITATTTLTLSAAEADFHFLAIGSDALDLL